MGGFRLRTIEVTADGRPIVRNRDLAGASATIGRAAENTLHLPDLALDPRHAVLTLEPDGRVRAEAAGTLGFGLDGRSVTSGIIDPANGGELGFGGYRIAVSRDEDGAVLLTVSEHQAPEASANFTLAGLLPGRRVLSWSFIAAILALFLAWPIASNLARDPADKTQRVGGDAAWSSGPLSFAHRTLSDKCEACHVKPFEAVRDQTCVACHKDVSDHAAPPRLADARGQGGAGDRALWRVAHAFGKPGPGACSDGHTEHEGAAKMPPPAQAFCADCHEGLKGRLGDTKLGDAADFGKLHPQFQPQVAMTMGSDKLTRVSLGARPREASGLAFPHDKHLDRRGGVARMAARLGGSFGSSGLACKDCHRSTADGVRFLPIEMERDCETCHSLAYDKVGPTFRRLRHGNVAAMIADLTAAGPASRPMVGGRRRPGEYASGGLYAARFSPAPGGSGLVAQALSTGGICGECHLPSAAGGRFGVVPVTQTTRFFQHGWFTHKAHRQEKCTNCHLAEKSASSADLLLPDLKSCRTCHLGEDAAAPKVPSGCAMCHDYHVSPLAPRGLAPGKRR